MFTPGFIRCGGYTFRPLLEEDDVRYLLHMKDVFHTLRDDCLEKANNGWPSRRVSYIAVALVNVQGEWCDPEGNVQRPLVERASVWRKGITWEATFQAEKGVVLTQTFMLPWKKLEDSPKLQTELPKLNVKTKKKRKKK